jgi:hypothetical protein
MRTLWAAAIVPLMSRYFGTPISDYIFLYDRATAFRPKPSAKGGA